MEWSYVHRMLAGDANPVVVMVNGSRDALDADRKAPAVTRIEAAGTKLRAATGLAECALELAHAAVGRRLLRVVVVLVAPAVPLVVAVVTAIQPLASVVGMLDDRSRSGNGRLGHGGGGGGGRCGRLGRDRRDDGHEKEDTHG